MATYLLQADEQERDRLRRLIKVGWHCRVDVTDMPASGRHQVNQVYCSAVHVGHNRVVHKLWEPLARLLLEAAYEATLLAAALEVLDGGSRRVLLTGLGGGVFGNSPQWISDAIESALVRAPHAGLNVLMLSYREIPAHFQKYV